MTHIEESCDRGVRPTRGSDRDLSGVHLTGVVHQAHSRLRPKCDGGTVQSVRSARLTAETGLPMVAALLTGGPASFPMYRSRLEQVSQERKQYSDPCERS